MGELLVLASLVDGALRVESLAHVLDRVGYAFACEADLKRAIRRLQEQGLVAKDGEAIALTPFGRERLKADQWLSFLAAQREKLK